ncbi:sensor histidine kinase [Isoptericola sp. NPDC057191]|uniref:sensor histidine kinase n=1 Tax=Isoptericola sp. NPDC057191 TaxID=3346041 RepID=UPI0036385F0F
MPARPAHPALATTRGLQVGLDVLVGGLVLFSVGQVLVSGGSRGGVLTVVLLAAALLALYAVGRARVRVVDRPVGAPRGAWWPGGAWMLALGLLWLALAAAAPSALWLAFPLMLLQMHVLGPHRGVVAVVLTAGAAVAAWAWWSGTLVVGAVLGPLLGGAVAVGVVLGLEALVREAQERQRMLAELRATRADLAHAERDRAVAGERERLAREIHDTLAQGYSAIELLLRAARAQVGGDDDGARDGIDRARDVARENLAEARRFVRDLAPTDLAGAGETALAAALRRVAGRTADRGDVAVTVTVTGAPRAVGTPVETALLRVAQSALANVTQHAGAQAAAVTLSYLDDAVALDVVDDGVGFDPASLAPTSGPGRGAGRGAGSGTEDDAPGGYGLVAMRSRAAELGGTLSVESAPGRGTALAVQLPVPAAAPPRTGASAELAGEEA